MTKKQLKQVARKIADLEMIIQNSSVPDEVHDAKNEIMKYQSSLTLDDMIVLDALIQEMIK